MGPEKNRVMKMRIRVIVEEKKNLIQIEVLLKKLKRGILLEIHWVGLVKREEVQCKYNNKVMEIAKFFELVIC